MIDFNTEPYNDDYDESKKFYRILYRPSFAVQARELTQMQTILQNQISRHGSAIFKQGAMVIPGQCSVETVTNQNNGADYVKLQVSYNGVAVQTFISALEGATIVGASGVKAVVVKAQDAEGTEPTTLYIRYLTSGDNNTTKTFSDNEVIHTDDEIYQFQAASSDSTGKGSLATITRGVYYINGHFVLVEDQTIVLDKYSNTPSYRVGLQITESIVTPEQDETLLDNAQNSYNFAAPGAHRYYIDLTLTKLDIDSTTDLNFTELIRVVDGRVKTIVDKTDYSIIGDTLARRTYDESGDYTVREFGIDIREHRDNNRGQWVQNTAYLYGDIVTNAGKIYVAKTSGNSVTTAPTHASGAAYDGPGSTGIKWEWTDSPVYNRGIYAPEDGGDATKLAVGIEAGKAYIRGYEIQKDSTTYVTVDKARDYDQAVAAVVQPSVGNYVLVTNVNNLPPIDTLDIISLRDQVAGSGSPGTAAGNQIGTARVRFMEWHGGASYGSTAIYKLGLFDIQMNAGKDFNRNVKSFYYSVSSGDPNVSFEADINPVTTALVGSITASSGTTTGTGTSFQTDLVSGDYVVVDGTMYRVTATPGSQNSMTLNTGTFTGKAYSLATTQILEPQNSSLLFPLPNTSVRSLRSAGTGGVNNATYIVYQKFTQNASGVTLSLSTSGTFMSASGATNYIVVDNDISVGGAIINPVSIVPVGSAVTITLPSGQSGHSMTVIAAVQRTGSAFEKTKTLTTVTEQFNTAALAQQAIIYLDKADVLRVTSIKMAAGTAFQSSNTTLSSSLYTVDVSDRYTFDNGQRTTHYDWGSLTLQPSYTAPSGPVQVTYEYFEHGVGDYFDVNSYSGIDYSLINPTVRDSIDFRPRVANKSSGTLKNFISTGSSICGVPKRGENVTTDYSYYLSRKDKIAIDFNGKIFDVRGVPSTIPGDPLDPSEGMVIYTLSLNPYTLTTTDLAYTKIDNKRYTMRDIGKLESRISNLEYYTSLSLLETDTQSMKLTDSKGLDRMKNGFVVDSFSGSDTIGDPTKIDYYCAIDKENGYLRPFYNMQNVNLLEKNSNDTQRASSKYQLNGDIVTLPIIDTPVLIKQDYASRLENINPFAIITFLGNVSINPPTDDWFETTTLPDPFINKIEGNYNVIRNMAISAGIIGADNNYGIVWGPWRTDWIGASAAVPGTTQYLNESNSSRDTMNALGGNWWSGRGGWSRRDMTVQTFATQVGLARDGIKTTLKESYSYEQVGDRTVSKTLIPYMRSRNLLIQVRGLKPQTRFYGYFDDIDVNSYITPATKLVYTPTNSVDFDTITNVGGSASETKRRIAGDSEVCLNKGDVITTSNNSGSAVVVGTYVDPDSGAYILDVVNIIGTISNGQSFTGSVSGASGTVVSVTAQATLTTNKNGDLNLLFDIPNTDAVRFRTGGREFKLIDSATSTGDWTSRGRAVYQATGTLETKQGVINAVRNAELVREVIGPDDDPAGRTTIYQTSQRVVSDTGWYDPLAQSFLVQQKGGAFLTGIDIFFASKDDRIPVTLEIREMVNGTPGKNVLPFSRTTLKPEDVNLSSTMVTLSNGTSVDYQVPTFDTPTHFKFTTPVYVQDNAEYAFVLQSDSNNYKVWVSCMGDEIPGTSGRTISQQPYAGVMFKSQNASTWTPDQNQDIKFTIYRAQFDTSVVGNVQFVNDVLPYDYLGNDPFQTANGSTTVRVWHTNHGMYSGSSVTIDGVSDPVNGVPAAELNGTHVISNADKDCYTITTTTSATSSGYGGGSLARGTKNINYDLVNPSIQMQTFSDTKCTFNITTTSGKSIDGSQTPYSPDTTASPCLVKQDNYFDSPRVIASEINENTLMSGNKSVTFTCLISTVNDSVSPVIDTSRASLVAVNNIVNYPTEANTNVAALDVKTLFTGATGAFTFSATGFSSTVSAVRTAMAGIGIGRYITIASATTSTNNGTYLVTGYTDDGTTATITLGTNTSGGSFSGTSESAVSGTTVSIRELFYDEIAPDGSTTLSSFVTNPIKFANPSTYLRIRFSANIPTESDVLVYYKTCTGDKSQLDTTKYTLLPPDSSIKKVQLGDQTFTDIDYTLSGMAAYDTLAVKLVMKSTNSSAVPLIKDLRIISCP